MATIGEIFVVAASGSGHVLPCIELCKHLSSRNYTPVLVLPSTMSSVVPSPHLHAIATVIEITAPTRGNPTDGQMGSELETQLCNRFNSAESSSRVVCAIIDFPMGWTKHIFWKFSIPVISLFTFGACAAAMEWGAWKSRAGSISPGEVRLIPGLPEEMDINHRDLTRRPYLPPRPAGSRGPPLPGDLPPWVPLVEGSTALMLNTCDDLERPFINYLSNEMGTPAWGVGPLLPNQYWSLSDSLTHDAQIRQPKHQGNYTEDQILQWLDQKPEKSVLYVAFGSELSPGKEEILQLGNALEELSYPFIWVFQNHHENWLADDFDKKIGDRSLIVRGWAPQLLILSHTSTGGFLSHCGWNSIMEALGRGVPLLAWPIRGDQFYNAKLVVHHLKVGFMALPGGTVENIKEELVSGVHKVMREEGVRRQADVLRGKFSCGFPACSKIALDAFRDFLRQNRT